jgi:hypothetical protein
MKRHRGHKKEGGKSMKGIMQLCDVIRETGFAIHSTTGTDTWRTFQIKKYILNEANLAF